jgi:hypothetical protein
MVFPSLQKDIIKSSKSNLIFQYLREIEYFIHSLKYKNWKHLLLLNTNAVMLFKLCDCQNT